MNFRRSFALFSSLLLCLSATAHAGQYAATDLGKALPMWMETLADINDDGDVAWTEWGGGYGQNVPAGATTAQYHLDGVDAGLLAGARASSWAVGVSERVPDGTYSVVGIAGSDASSQRLTDRSALLWSLAWLNNGSSEITVADLGAATPPESGSRVSVQQSAAYGVVARKGPANTYYVGGFARDRVARSVLPKPVVWAVEAARSGAPTITAHRLQTLGGNLGHGNGYVSSVARNDETYWACGNSAPSDPALYVQATCWNMGTGPAINPAPVTTLNTTLSQKYGANLVTSMVHRVRVLPIGANGAKQTVAIGSALVGNKWTGWAYNLDSGAFWDNLNIANNAETLAYDAAAIQYAEEDGGTPSYGLMMGGVSRSVAGTPDNIIGDAPVGVNTGVLRGVERRMLLHGTTSGGQVCKINDDSTEQAAQYDQLVGLSSDGKYRLAMAGGQLVRLSEVDVPSVTVNVNQRRYQIKTSTRTAVSSPIQYFYAFADVDKEEAILRVSDELGCDAPGFSGTCNPADPVAFDIAAGGGEVALGNVNNTLRSAQESGVFPANRQFAQLALRSGSDCTITPVKATVATVLNPAKDHEDDTTQWAQCGANTYGGYNTDIANDVRHCGTCNNNVQALTCADNVCNDGTPAIGTVNANMCAIGSNNNWACYAADDQKAIPNTGAEVATNHCQQCKPGQDQQAWTTTTGTSCCDANAEPKITGWHNGYRPDPHAAGGNISYSGNNLQSSWVRRIAAVSDSDYWGEWYGGFCAGYRCNSESGRLRPQQLTSYISTADAEDWFVFRHEDRNKSGTSKSSYPRIRVKPNTNQQVQVCAYPRCVGNNYNAEQRRNWAHNLVTSISGPQHGRTRALEGLQPSSVSAANSPLREGGVGLPGACTTSSSNGGAADLAFIVEDYNKHDGHGACWNTDWFVQIRAESPSAQECTDTYHVTWGNWMVKGCSTPEWSPDMMRGRNDSPLGVCDYSGTPDFHHP